MFMQPLIKHLLSTRFVCSEVLMNPLSHFSLISSLFPFRSRKRETDGVCFWSDPQKFCLLTAPPAGWACPTNPPRESRPEVVQASKSDTQKNLSWNTCYCTPFSLNYNLSLHLLMYFHYGLYQNHLYVKNHHKRSSIHAFSFQFIKWMISFSSIALAHQQFSLQGQ